jgi:arginyl-tRNA synthetase
VKSELLKIVKKIDNSIKEIVLTKPAKPEFGDLTTNIALILGSKLKQNPVEIAKKIANELNQIDQIDKVRVIKPGFINIYLSGNSMFENVKNILKEKSKYGTSNALAGKNINLEYVSANPTGPIHIAGARWAAFGSALSQLLKSQNAKVINEYYVNDAGKQIILFIDSLYAKYKKLPPSENGYDGEYLNEIIKKLKPILDRSSNIKPVFGKRALEMMIENAYDDLEKFRTKFDVFFFESDLYKSDRVKSIITGTLKEFIYRKDDAEWLKTTLKGDEKDRVLVKNNRYFSYFASDLAYLQSKMDRGFTELIYILGADHHGYINRLKAGFELLGYKSEKLNILIGQLVTLLENGKVVKMSKRNGKIITLNDLVEKIGVDAGRYALLRSSINSPLKIDLDIWKKKSADNPVYYIQYAHARCYHIEQRAKRLKLEASTNISSSDYEKYLSDSLTKDLLGNLSNYPKTLLSISKNYQIHKLPNYLENLATSFHKWYKNNRVVPFAGEKILPINSVRLAIVIATKIVIKNGLTILKVGAPNQM